MQALKKAERAKQNSVADEELDKPSEEFDQILALTPEPAPPRMTKPPAAADFSLEPMDGLSLEPLAPPVAATAAPRPSPSPLPAASDHKEPGLTMDLALDPIAAPPAPTPAASAVTAPAGMTQADAAGSHAAATARSAAAGAAAAGATYTAATAGAAAGIAAAGGAGPTASATPRHAATPAPHAGASAGTTASAGHATGATAGSPASTTTTAAAGSQAASKGGGASAAKPGAAARARARTASTAEPTGFDPERLRLIGLIAVLVLLVGGFGIYYWIALTGPGAGASLPPVPMPPAGATGATPGAGQIIAASNPGAGPGSDNAALDADNDPLLAQSGGSRSNQQDLERRLARTEQELAAAQQAIQAAAAPRAEQMPVLAAPRNDDIRVTRLVQPAPVSPTLDSAYQAFNSGDTAGAQVQYEAALAQDANSRDALLGAAHVAARQNLKDKAAGYYLRLLELSPNDADATAGLIGLRQGDISQSEARLKAILASNPDSASLQFALGNLYAQQGRWPDAQQAYFRAVGAAPDNPDYAYNLAIGLDRLNQGKLALTYYQRALALAQDKAVGFDRNTLRKRMHELSTGTH
jgi:tetratricopeptide (TPR) repeat protein